MTTTLVDYGDIWVCTDCYFSHHYGMRLNDGLWYAGEDDEPVGGQYMIDRGDFSHNLEPLGRISRDFEVADNTCSNHYYGQDVDDWSDEDNPPCDQCGQVGAEDGLTDFTWRSCDGCGSHLGGSRSRLHLWKREEET